MRLRSLVTVLSLTLWSAACGHDEQKQVTSPRTASDFVAADTTLPTIALLASIGEASIPMVSEDLDHAVGTQGEILTFLPPSSPDGPAGLVVDASGQLARSFGRSGEGPGEFRMPIRSVGMPDHSWVVFDAALMRLNFLSPAGDVINHTALTEPLLPIGGDRDAVYLAKVGGSDLEIRRVGLDLTTSTILTMESIRAVEPTAFVQPAPSGRAKVPAVGFGQSRIAVADPWSYAIYYFTPDGKLLTTAQLTLPVRRRTPAEVAIALDQASRFRGPDGSLLDPSAAAERLREEVLPYFSHVSPLGIDAKGRLWIVRSDAGATVADVFADSLYVGQVTIPCWGFEGRWSIADLMLSVACRSSHGGEGAPPVVQVYRID